MTMKIFVPLVILFLIVQSVFAQSDKIIRIDAFVCDSIGNAIKDVGVYDTHNNLRGVSNSEGVAHVATHIGESLILSHVSFQNKGVTIRKDNLMEGLDGRYSIIIEMRHRINALQEVTVIDNVPQLAYENEDVWIMDYKVTFDGICVLAGNSLGTSLMYLDYDQDTMAQKTVSSKYQELFYDAFRNIHIISADSVYQVFFDSNRLSLLYGNTKEVFYQKLKPLVVSTPLFIVMEERAVYNQQVYYLIINKKTREKQVLRRISGKTFEMASNWELDDYRLRLINDIDYDNKSEQERIRNEERLDFLLDVQKRLMLQPIYCPIFDLGTKLIVFDFENDFLVTYNQDGKYESQIPIDFHLRDSYFSSGLNQKSWNKKIIRDEATGQFYAEFITDGIVTLKEIDLNNGKVKREIRLSDHSFPQNIQVYDGYAYYLYLDKRSVADRDKRSLYKMKL